MSNFSDTLQADNFRLTFQQPE